MCAHVCVQLCALIQNWAAQYWKILSQHPPRLSGSLCLRQWDRRPFPILCYVSTLRSLMIWLRLAIRNLGLSFCPATRSLLLQGLDPYQTIRRNQFQGQHPWRGGLLYCILAVPTCQFCLKGTIKIDSISCFVCGIEFCSPDCFISTNYVQGVCGGTWSLAFVGTRFASCAWWLSQCLSNCTCIPSP